MNIITYREKEYPVRAIVYHERFFPDDTMESTVSCSPLNDILYADTQVWEDKAAERDATDCDDSIAFFIPERHFQKDNAGIMDALNEAYKEFCFTEVNDAP